MEKGVKFVRIGTKPCDNHTYALDANGVVWMNIEADLWESLEPEPRQIRQVITIDLLPQIMSHHGRRSAVFK
jgi:hypothetical protein